MRATKRNANAADHGDTTNLKTAHATLRSKRQESSINVRLHRVVRYRVVLLRRPAPYNRRMKTPSLAATVAAVLAAGCGSTDPEVEIRAVLAAAEGAAESRDAGFFADLVAESYRDSHGNDRDQLVRTVRGLFLANQRIEVVSRVDEIVLEGADAARAVLHAGMLGQRSGAELLAGVDADLYRFELELVNDGEWQVIGAKWNRALGE